MGSKNPYRRNYYAPHTTYRHLQQEAKAMGLSASPFVLFLFREWRSRFEAQP